MTRRIQKSVVIFLIAIIQRSDLIPVSRSYIRTYPSDVPCKIWHWDLHPDYNFKRVTEKAEHMFPLIRKFSRHYADVIEKGSNCTIDFQYISGSIGDFTGFDENGTARFNGLIGDLQDHKYDFAVYYLRPDSIPHQPVLIGPVLSAADVGILTGTSPPKQERLPFMSFIKNFDKATYAYTVIAVHFMICSLMFISCMRKGGFKKKLKKRFSLYRLAKRYYSHCFKSFAACIRHQLFSPQRLQHRILILSFSLFCFFTISGYFLNLFSADLTVTRAPPVINSLSDLLSERFNHVDVVIMRKLWLKNMLSASPADSQHHQLYKRIMSNPSVTMFDMNSDMSVEQLIPIMTRYAMLIKDEKIACLAPKRWGSLFTVKLFCQYDPDFKDSLHISHETFAPGLLTFAFSKKVNPVLRHFLEYRFRTFHEMEMVGWVETQIKLMDTPVMSQPEHKMLKCNWFMRNETETVLTGVTFDLVKSPMLLFAQQLLTVIPILLLEICWFSAVRYTRQWISRS
jgi:hypothetical protein